MADVRSLARLASIRSRFKRAMNMNVVLDKTGFGYQFRINGFKYDDFDRAGFVNPVKVNRMMETNRFVTVTSYSFDGGEVENKASSPTMFYVLGGHMTCSQGLYTKAAVNLPMIYENRPVRVGTTSLDTYQALYDETVLLAENASFKLGDRLTQENACKSFLASRVFRIINVDAQTKRPKPLSETLQAQLSKIMSLMKSADSGVWIPPPFPADMKLPEVVPPKVQSSGAFYTCEIRVKHDDLDCFFHANQGSYLAYVSDCAAQAAAAGVIKNFVQSDICFRNVHTVSSMYSAESHAGDRLSVTTWEDESDPCVLNFVITRDGRLVYRSKFVYHPIAGIN